jgi:hypothetical protein
MVQQLKNETTKSKSNLTFSQVVLKLPALHPRDIFALVHIRHGLLAA